MEPMLLLLLLQEEAFCCAGARQRLAPHLRSWRRAPALAPRRPLLVGPIVLLKEGEPAPVHDPGHGTLHVCTQANATQTWEPSRAD